jgi:hypothetical protein
MALVAGQVPVSGYRIPDYSGAAQAAGAAAAAPYQVASGLIGQVGDYFKQQGEQKKLIKKSQTQIDAALKLFPDLAPALQGASDQIRDENIPLSDRVAAAESITGLINMGIGEMRNAQNMLMEQQKLGLEQAYKGAQLQLEERKTQASELKAQQAGKPSYQFKTFSPSDPTTGEVYDIDLPYNPQTGRPIDPKVGKEIIDIQSWFEGKEAYAPEPAMPTSTSQVMPSDGKFGFTYNTRDKLPASTANARQISLDFNAAANKNAKGIEIIIPNNATSIERALAMDYVNQTKEFFASKGVDVPVRGVKTAAENKRGSANRFHTEPFFVHDSASRAAIESDPDGYAQVLANTIGKIPGAMFIPPHKSNDPGASANGINERDFAKGTIIPALERLSKQQTAATSPTGIDNALAMTGDLSQQAMGTPQQQAEIARMISEGSGMATAQNTPQGAVPTEAPRTFTPRPGAVLRKSQTQAKETKIVTGDEAKALDLDPRGTYETRYEDGRLASVQTIKAAPTISETLALEKREEEKVAKQQMAAATAEKSARMVELMTELKNHPGFENLFGATWWPTGIAGSPGADAMSLFRQIEAMGFMEAIKDMRGQGALSDAEGQKASAAFVGITPDMSEAAAKKKIDEVIGYIKKGQERLQSGKLISQPTPETKPEISEINSYYDQIKNQTPAR